MLTEISAGLSSLKAAYDIAKGLDRATAAKLLSGTTAGKAADQLADVLAKLYQAYRQSDAELKAFAENARKWPLVREAWMVSGDSDFLLHCVAADLGIFQNFVIEELTAAPNVDTVRTALTIRQVKDDGLVRIG